VNDEALSRAKRAVLVVPVGIAPWNMGDAYLAGLLLNQAIRRRIVDLEG
jgi:hypothetical protein